MKHLSAQFFVYDLLLALENVFENQRWYFSFFSNFIVSLFIFNVIFFIILLYILMFTSEVPSF